MGIPQHYSHQLPMRCLELIEWLYPIVHGDEDRGRSHAGPLTTTLLISLATPMIVLPFERILKQQQRHPDFVDESAIDPILTKAVFDLFKTSLKESGFYEGVDWAFSRGCDIFNLAERLPQEIAAELADEDARKAAAAMPFNQFASCLRNALSHGGVMYLDETGKSSDSAASMYAFVSGKTAKQRLLCPDKKSECIHSAPPIDKLNVLRVSEAGFLEFVQRWGKWLQESGATEELGKFVSAS